MVVTITCNFIAASKTKTGGSAFKHDPCHAVSFTGSSVSMHFKTLCKKEVLTDAIEKPLVLKQNREKLFLPGLQSLMQSVILLFVFPV